MGAERLEIGMTVMYHTSGPYRITHIRRECGCDAPVHLWIEMRVAFRAPHVCLSIVTVGSERSGEGAIGRLIWDQAWGCYRGMERFNCYPEPWYEYPRLAIVRTMDAVQMTLF
jgi:hypothetical protein